MTVSPCGLYDSSSSRSSISSRRSTLLSSDDDRLGELAFARLQLEDFFFDGVAGDEAVGDDRLLAADAVGAVDGLRFDGGVPPGVEQEDVVGVR